ncbi:MAG: SurA N-terminal domain-containing protein [Actinomycetota bacterium]|nr:SurA N-terminal domain-containing protein [Actinomycetota bacterium]
MRSAVVRERRGLLRAVAVTVVAVGILVGCGSGPSQLGAAALVGDTVIPLDRVQQQLDLVLVKEGEQAKAQLVAGKQLDDVSREILTQAVRHELLAVAAQREGLSIDDERVTDLLNQFGGPEVASAGTVYDAQGIRSRARDQLLAIELGREYLPHLSVTVDYTTARTRTEAMQRVQQLSEAGPARARKIIAADAEQGVAAALDQKIIAAENPGLAAAPIFGVRAGTVVAFTSDQDSGSWLVAVVTDRSTNAQSGRKVDEVDLALLEAAGLRQLVPLAKDLGVRINPRYGVWDPVAVRIVPNKNETAGFIAPLHESAAA